MNLQQLRVFCEVASTRSFTAAAARLHLTQPAVSWQMRRLEEVAGLKLVERVGKRLSLTEEGKVLLECANRVFRTIRETEEALANLRGQPLGMLRIDATYIAADYYLPAFLEALHRRHPGVTFQLGIGNSSQVIERTLAQTNDIGICAYDPVHPKLEAREIFSDRLVAVVAPDHPFARRRSLPVRALAGQPLIVREAGSSPRRLVDEMLAAHGVTPNVVMESASIAAIKRFVEDGLGVAILSRQVVSKELQEGTLRRILLSDAEITYRFYLIRQRDRWVSRALHAFVELAESFRLRPVAVRRPRRPVPRGRR